MKTLLHIWRLRFRLWQHFGFPFGPHVPQWRVILRSRKLPGGAVWYFYNRIDGQSLTPPMEGRADCEIGPVFGGPTFEEVLEHARQQWKQTSMDVHRFNMGEYRPFAPPAAPPPGPPPEPSVPGHEKQWNAALNGMVCECGWQSPSSSHTLHLYDGPCAECRKIWEEWWHHLAATETCEAISKEQPNT